MRSVRKCAMIITGAFHTDGGIACVNRIVLKALGDSNYKTDVFVLTEDDDTIDERYIDPSLITYRVFHNNKLKFASTIWRCLLTENYTTVFVDHVNIASVIVPLSMIKLCRYVVWLHGVEVWPPRPDGLGRLGVTYSNKRLSGTSFTKERFQEAFPHLSVEVCDLCLDPVRHKVTAPENLRTGLTMQAVNGKEYVLENRIILHVARMSALEQMKGQDVLIQAMPQILHRHPEAQLVLVGKGDDYPRLLSLAKSHSLAIQERVFFTGYVADDLLDQLYYSCYMFVMPSRSEGFGFAYIEAMSRGVPCIGGRLDAAQCIIEHEKTGLLINDPTSFSEVGQAVVHLLNNPELVVSMGKNARNVVQTRYMYHIFQQRFLTLMAL